MGIQTIAEFVEDDNTVEELRRMRVDFAQGYAIHRPEPLKNILIDASENKQDDPASTILISRTANQRK